LRIGFVGTGAISSAMVTGLASDGSSDCTIRVSPRNAEKAQELARRFSNVSVSASNQEILDDSELVVLAVKPAVVRMVISQLHFRPEHLVVSVIAGLSLRTISALVAPASRVTRAVPLPSVAEKMGPTAVFPPDSVVAELFGRIGVAVEVASEEEFDALSVSTATIASYFAFMETITSWLRQHGVSDAVARDYIASVFRGLTHSASRAPQRSFQSLADEHQTAGGINEQVLKYLGEHGVFQTLEEGLDVALRRVRIPSG
jgi:pyrroline-5-carboxylate reductase